MKKFMRFCCLVLCCLILFTDVTVYASNKKGQGNTEKNDSSTPGKASNKKGQGNTEKNDSSTPGKANTQTSNSSSDGSDSNNGNTDSGSSTQSNADLYASLDALIHYGFSTQEEKDGACECVSLMITTLKTSGFSDAATAGIMANAAHEGYCLPFTIQNMNRQDSIKLYLEWKGGAREGTATASGPAEGLIQFDWWRPKFEEWSVNNDPDRMTVTDGKGVARPMAGLEKQVIYIVTEMTWGGNTNVVSHLNIKDVTSLDVYKTLTDPAKATKAFCACVEKPNDTENRAAERAKDAEAWLGIVGGNYNWASYVSESQAAAVGSGLVAAGYWTEEDLAAFCKLNELNVDDILEDAKRENLNQEELNGLSIWERNVAHDIEENGLIVWVRRIIMWAGILLTIWMSLIYFAYWFDRINNLFYIDALGLMTMGHLHMSETESECTFRVKDIGKDNHKTVNHRTVIFICLVGFAFGVCIVTGVFYDFLQLIVYKIFRLLGKY